MNTFEVRERNSPAYMGKEHIMTTAKEQLPQGESLRTATTHSTLLLQELHTECSHLAMHAGAHAMKVQLPHQMQQLTQTKGLVPC